MFPNFFYSDQSSITKILAAGFCIDNIENYFTEERRIAHNKKCVENPLALVYHISNQYKAINMEDD